MIILEYRAKLNLMCYCYTLVCRVESGGYNNLVSLNGLTGRYM